MSEGLNRLELLSIAGQFRRLDVRTAHSDYPAGKLLAAVIGRGAFSGPEFILLRDAVASAPENLTFRMAVDWLAEMTQPPPEFCTTWAAPFVNPGNEWRKINYNAVADLIEREADKETAVDTSGAESEGRMAIATNPPQVTIDGNVYALTDTQADFLQQLLDARNWVSGKAFDLGTRAGRIRKSLPGPVLDAVESRDGVGFRVRPGYLA